MTTKHGVLILRPHDQAEALEQEFLQQTEQPVATHIRSMVDVVAFDDPRVRTSDVLAKRYSGALMVSVNAARFLSEQMQRENLTAPIARWFAVGPTSARAIARVVARPVTCPQRVHNSEALLALSELNQIAGQRWLIVRGKGGRELLADTLTARGATVDYLEVYERKPHPISPAELAQWHQYVRGIVVSSAEQLGYFLAAIPREQLSWLADCYWVVASDRLAALLPGPLRQRAVVAQSAATFAMFEAWQQATQMYQGNTKL